jgi:hypothetical protein
MVHRLASAMKIALWLLLAFSLAAAPARAALGAAPPPVPLALSA